MSQYNVTLKNDKGVRTYKILAHDIFTAWQQAVSIYGGVVCD